MQNKNRQYCRALSIGLAVAMVIAVPFLIDAKSHQSEYLGDPESTLCDTASEISIIEISSAESESVGEITPTVKSLGEFTLTAYCPCVKCCGEWSMEHPSRIGTDYIQKTASGTIPKAGRTIGVDPNVIPFGTVVVINDHTYVAEDRGGAIKGNSIDIFFDDHNEALEFGRQTAEVFIKN